jgi:O-antigen ligase
MFTGIGASNQIFVLRDYLPVELMGDRNILYQIHNRYLAILAEIGLFGFLAFIWFRVTIIWRALKASINTVDPYVAIFLAGLMAAQIGNAYHMSADAFDQRLPNQIVWFGAALITATVRLSKTTKHLENPLTLAETNLSI